MLKSVSDFERAVCENFDTYPCGSKSLDETVEVEERTGLDVMYVM